MASSSSSSGQFSLTELAKVKESQGILDLLPNSIFVLDLERKFVYANKEFLRLSEAALLIGNHGHYRELITGDENGEEEIEDVLKGEKKSLFVKVKKSSGEEVSLEMRAEILHTDDKPSAVMFSAVDRSYLTENVQEYQKQVHELEAANQAKGEFLANMSHELRSPMTSIIALGQLILETDLNAEQRENLEIMFQSAKGLLNIINDTLDFSKLDAGKVDLESIPFNLNGLIESCMQASSVQTKDKPIELLVDYSSRFPHDFLGDPSRIRQILNNFLSNGIKFTEKGHVLVRVSELEQEDGMSRMQIRVEDTGIGISDEAIKKLFQKFQQADTSTTRKYGGTGLGLAICRQLAELMGGKVACERMREGSAFSIEIPLKVNEVAQGPMDEGKLEGVRVLCVDDNLVSLKILTRMLNGSGIHADACRDAERVQEKCASALAEGKPYQVIIIDYMMPEVNGVELARIIKKDENMRDLRMVMHTAVGKKGEASMMLEEGFMAYLTKPLSKEVLLDVVSLVMVSDPDNLDSIITKYTVIERKEQAKGDEGIKKIEQKKVDSAQVEPQNFKVLVAEDDPTNQRVIKKLLKRMKCEFDMVDNGGDAVTKVASGEFQVVLMDWHMPVMDGLSATREIRKTEAENKRSWIIALTAGGEENVRERCLDAGMDDFVAKPFEVDKFMEAVKHGMGMINEFRQSD